MAVVARWLHEIDANCDVVNRILVGNKNDDPDRKVVHSLPPPPPPGGRHHHYHYYHHHHHSQHHLYHLHHHHYHLRHLYHHQVVLTEDARRFADQMGIQLFETSAKVLVVGVVC